MIFPRRWEEADFTQAISRKRKFSIHAIVKEQTYC
jgi:hypothetical protein